ncbi:ATP synthase F1 subunit delta [Paraflavitalea sp. CAU 1676]|uniref:ATP synthase F1 subunit delta n=1 Tax=Paraflavitalea sp. CAU 1676 TaxID=3032598 RepID=UPI0023DBAAAF|nr:ATP synthase F1 subunit delta [Paraflavitalea sp. CAU 1676]MDF2187264.1 ATP synthase F1 subunit delta [Paraflavitalea sp. CAU 1676]
MLNPRLAGRYAKSLIDLAIERNQLEDIYKDMLFMQAVCKGSREFVALLKSPVVASDKKDAILKAITDGKVSEITTVFNKLLVNKGRESGLPEIITAFIAQYKKHKGIHTVKLTTAVPVGEDVKQQIISKIQEQTPMKNVELETAVKDELIGGFVLELGGTLVDGSILYDLNKIKSQFMNNDFIYKIR